MLEAIIKKAKKAPLFNSIKNKYPKFTLHFVVRPISYFRYGKERAVEKGKDISQGTTSSIILFTAHKCASTLVTKILRQICEPEGVVHIDFDSYFSITDNDKYNQFHDEVFLNRALKSKGYYYGAFRHYRPIPNLHHYRSLLMLRDPRDVVTSSYFSTAYSHMPINEELLEQRESALNMSIDDYVIMKAAYFKEVYSTYVSHLLGKQGVLFLRYEDMVGNFPVWLDKVIEHVQIEPSSSLKQQILNEVTFKKTNSEDKYNHVRSVQPGDHIRKLQPATIEKLNEIFEQELLALGYLVSKTAIES